MFSVIDLSNDDKIQISELIKVCDDFQMFEHHREIKRDTIIALFEQLDTDSNGTIDLDEFMLVVGKREDFFSVDNLWEMWPELEPI